MASQNTTIQKGGITSFFRGVKQEMKKVQWPTNRELVRYTIVVFITVVFISLLIMLVDFVFMELFRLFAALLR